MAGGIGSRFWPFSTHEKPKQFLDILGTGRSLIQMTFDRLSKICPADQIYIVTNDHYKALINEQLPEIIGDNILFDQIYKKKLAGVVGFEPTVHDTKKLRPG